MLTWEQCHAKLRDDAQAYVPSGVTQLVLLGDSITESWRGTSYGRSVARTKGVPAVLSASLATQWPSPLALGIAADCTQHLLWRMMHGELSSAMKQAPHLVFVMLIGTNNLGRGHSTDETTQGIVACAQYVLNATRGQLVLNALLPRGDRRRRGRKKGRGFLGDIQQVNAALNGSVNSVLASKFPGRARYVDCGAPFLLSPGHPTPEARSGKSLEAEVVDRTLMPDRLHPNVAGHRKWAACLRRSIEGGKAPVAV